MPGIDDNICFNEDTKEEILSRLRRAEGQLRGIQKMVEDGRSCHDLAIQLVAVKAAITQIAVTALSNQLVHCLRDAGEESIETITAKFVDVFKKLS
jgi:DNA-binding FrmR family transcriptional regulator